MKSTVRAVGTVMAITVLSRLMSLFSNMAYITFFGINLETDVYAYATQLPNIIFNSLGTAIVTVVIPVFAGYIGTGERDRAFRFANNISGLSLVLTAVLSAAGVLLSPFILHLTRFKENGYGFALTALRIMFPVMIFYALNYILQGVLQSLGRYSMPAMVSLPGSILMILYIILLGGRYGVRGLITATFIGLAMQALILIPPAARAGYVFRPSFDFRDEDVWKSVKLIPPILVGTSAYQLNMLFNATLSANFKDTVSVMTTVQNLVLYAVLAFVYSITAVIFPQLTMLAARGDMDGFKESLQKVLRSVIFLLIPSTAGFIAVRSQLVDFLYGWGKITAENLSLAGGILALYALGITGVGIKEVADRAFFSLKDTRKPAIAGVTIMGVNIASSLVLVSFLGVMGIPLAYSLSALTGAFLLVLLLRKKIGGFGGRILLNSTFKVMLASVIMLLAVVPLNLVLGKAFLFEQAVLDKGIRLFLPAAAGAAVYIAAAYAMRTDEAVRIVGKARQMLYRKV